MPRHLRPRRSSSRVVAAVLAALALGAAGGTALALDAREPVERVALAEARNPAGADGMTLGLSRVTVEPGARLALHRHPGTQVARIARGALTYTVVTGSVTVRRGDPERNARVVRQIRAGQTAVIRAGQWIVERPGTIHRARNAGEERIVIWLSTLFRTGAPPAIPVER